MKTFAAVLVAIVLCSAMAPADVPSESTFRFPSDGNDLLDYCGEMVNQLDSPATQLNTAKEIKFAWCVGYLQATVDGIVNWRMAGAIQLMAYQKDGKSAPAHMWADEDFVDTCIPDQASIAQLARVVIKWLRDHPEKLHELKHSLVADALKNAFPCAGPTNARPEKKP